MKIIETPIITASEELWDKGLKNLAYVLKRLCDIGYITSLELQALYKGISNSDYCSTSVEGRLITLIDKSIYSWTFKVWELDLDEELLMLIQISLSGFNVVLNGEHILNEPFHN